MLEHRESTARQYNLRSRALEWGWPRERVRIIDRDQGHTGTTIEGRLGFQPLLAEVSLDHVGLILGIEMSRLARSCKDWHQRLELCAWFDTLLADPDGVYNPQNDNDRLRLGWKGTLSEAELHRLRQRMEQGRRNQARRGERFSHPPIGSVRGPSDDLQMDPGTLVRESFLGPTSVGIPSHESGARGSRLTDAHVSWSQEGIPAWMGARWESRTSEF